MTYQLAINGFGRIGRNILRAVFESGRDDINVVAINDLAPLEIAAHLFRNDSVHGRFNGSVEIKGDALVVNNKKIAFSSERDPAALQWHSVDVALECTGAFTERSAAAAHLNNGSKKVLVSAPTKNADRTIVFGVNQDAVKTDDRVISNASCTTNCLAPVAHVLDCSVGIETGYMTTIHSYTGDQPTLDAAHSDPYRARSAAMSMIPTSTGAARAVGDVLPSLAGKLDGSAIRVPTPNVSVVDLSFVASRPTSSDEINKIIAEAANNELKGILGISEEPLVSIDYNHDQRSSVVASNETRVMHGTLVRVLSWYDNEWGFSNRMLDTAAFIAAKSQTDPATAGNHHKIKASA